MANKEQWTNENTILIVDAAKIIGIKKEVIQYYADEGVIECHNGRILKRLCEEIKNQRNTYIGLKEFILMHDTERFDAKHVKDRNKYIDYLEYHEYFGIELYLDQVLFCLPNAEEVYFKRDDINFLNYKSIDFFENFGLSGKQIVDRIIYENRNHPKNIYWFKRIDELFSEEKKYTPSYIDYAKAVLSAEEIDVITNEDIALLIDEVEHETAKQYIVNFYKKVRDEEFVKYNAATLKRKESATIQAYSYEIFTKLARFFFSQKYDDEHELTIKALNNHIYSEMWLFLALHYVCGWRTPDKCNDWVYLDLQDADNPFGIDPEHLYDDIVNHRISDKTYADIALYAITKIEMSWMLAGKTHNSKGGKLRSVVTPELRVFYGKLMLIAEHHHVSTGEGYMKASRVSRYANWTQLRDFFGEEILEVIGRHNISPRRLNKSYLQGVESTARENGETPLVAHIVASLARNHIDVNSTIAYLKDHGLTGENADVVLYMMMQRGVMGVYLYKTLLSAFPDRFRLLTSEEQTKLIGLINTSAYELEAMGMGAVTSDRLYSDFSQGETEEPTDILKAMYSIGQGRGVAKDPGIYCLKRALGFSCANPTFESCIANVCPYHVFTREGVPSLLRVIKEFREKPDPTGKNKYKLALKKIIIPAFQSIINEVLKEMSDQDKQGIKKMIEEGLGE